MILIIIRKVYPAAEPDALVDIVLVGVVIPLDAVQNRSSADHQRCREEDDHCSTRKERMKRVVVPLADTPQKRDCRTSFEQANSRTIAFWRPTLPVLVRARTGTGQQERNTTVNKFLPLMCICMLG